MRETLQLHTSGVERSHAIQDIVRSIRCDESYTYVRKDLKDKNSALGVSEGCGSEKCLRLGVCTCNDVAK